eukprot:NODE_178_length_14069_cov_0.746815.p6 type:complete len:290 gc:universal NODE_178_length_14069_cov_0.746815:4556-3687(-)
MEPLFPSIANTITKASNYTRLSIRCCALMIEASIEALRYTAESSINNSRSFLSSAVYNPQHLENYSSLGATVIHHAFNLTELITMTTLNLATASTRISSQAAEELCKLVDGLFGSTETSRALAAVVELLQKELCPESTGVFAKVAITGTITKCLIAYSLLQFNVYHRLLSDFQLDHLGHAIVNSKVDELYEDEDALLQEYEEDIERNLPQIAFAQEMAPENAMRLEMKRTSLNSLLKSPSIESLKPKSVPSIINHYDILDKYKGKLDRKLLLELQTYMNYSLAAYGTKY